MQKTHNGEQLHDRATGDAERPDGLSKYHCKYWQLCPVPCLTPLIHLPLPPFSSIPCPFSNQCSSFCRIPQLLLPLRVILPSLKSDPDGQMSPFQTTSVSLDSRVRPVFFFFLKELGQWDINRHKGPDAGGRDRSSFPLQTEKKKRSSITHKRRTQAAVFTASGNHWPATDRNSN